MDDLRHFIQHSVSQPESVKKRLEAAPSAEMSELAFRHIESEFP